LCKFHLSNRKPGTLGQGVDEFQQSLNSWRNDGWTDKQIDRINASDEIDFVILTKSRKKLTLLKIDQSRDSNRKFW